MVDELVPARRPGAAGVGGAARRGGDRPRVHRGGPGLPGGGPGVRRLGGAPEGHSPAQPSCAGGVPRAGRRAGAAAARSGGQSDRAARLRTDPARRHPDGRRSAHLPIRGCRPRRTRRGRLAADSGHRGPRRADAGAGPGQAAAARDPAGRRGHARRARPARRGGDRGRGPGRAGRRALAARRRERPPRIGCRARAYRLGVAVAAARDGAQGVPHVRQCDGARA